MAEAISLVANVLAVIQLAERVASICKFYIGEADDYPKDLRLIYVEIASLKVIFEGLSFLNPGSDQEEAAALKALQGKNGPIQGCKQAVEELGKLLPPVPLDPSVSGRLRKEKLKMALASLAWPLKASTAQQLLEEINQYKATISVAMQGQLS